MAKFQDLTGQKFKRLTVVERAENKGNQTMWLCRCDCGNELVVCAGSLKRSHTQSCGCMRKEHPNGTTHGMSKTRIYREIARIKQRCFDTNSRDYRNYGGRGITVCDEWLGKQGVKNFIKWALSNGYEDGLTIERIDVNGNYEPSNCRWATRKEQNNNKRNNHLITYNGKTQNLKQWSDEIGINYSTLKRRINQLNWSVEKAFTKTS